MYLLTVVSHCDKNYCLVSASNIFQMWEINKMHSTENHVEQSDHTPSEHFSFLISDKEWNLLIPKFICPLVPNTSSPPAGTMNSTLSSMAGLCSSRSFIVDWLIYEFCKLGERWS